MGEDLICFRCYGPFDLLWHFISSGSRFTTAMIAGCYGTDIEIDLAASDDLVFSKLQPIIGMPKRLKLWYGLNGVEYMSEC